MKLVAVSFLAPVRFGGEFLNIARKSEGYEFHDHDRFDALRVRRGARMVIVPLANCVQEFELHEAPQSLAEHAATDPQQQAAKKGKRA